MRTCRFERVWCLYNTTAHTNTSHTYITQRPRACHASSSIAVWAMYGQDSNRINGRQLIHDCDVGWCAYVCACILEQLQIRAGGRRAAAAAADEGWRSLAARGACAVCGISAPRMHLQRSKGRSRCVCVRARACVRACVRVPLLFSVLDRWPCSRGFRV